MSFKVWPAEVEALTYQHGAIQECCVIAAPDSYRGETVKACIVLKPDSEATANDIVLWARQKMAAYKVPLLVEFVEALPKSATGKVLWRELQAREMNR